MPMTLSDRLTSQIPNELPASPGKPYWHVPAPVLNVHVRSRGLLCRDARTQYGARALLDRGIRQLFGVNLSPLRLSVCVYPKTAPFSNLFNFEHSFRGALFQIEWKGLSRQRDRLPGGGSGALSKTTSRKPSIRAHVLDVASLEASEKCLTVSSHFRA
jgi:hypothetical protein